MVNQTQVVDFPRLGVGKCLGGVGKSRIVSHYVGLFSGRLEAQGAGTETGVFGHQRGDAFHAGTNRRKWLVSRI
jgi:hypothetical protein